MDAAKQLDVVTFGETMTMFNPDQNGPLRGISGYLRSLGGAESNVAMALSRLGMRAGWFSRLGSDEFGKFILNSVRGDGVDTSRVIFDPEAPTGLMFKERFQKKNPNVYYYRKGSAASRLSPEDIDPDYIRSARILHVTGITLAISESARRAVFRAVEIARQSGVTVSFDPNLRLKLWSAEEARRVILELAPQADIMLSGDDEGLLLTGKTEPQAIAEEFLKMGNKTVVVKMGKDGCYAQTAQESCRAQCFPTELKEDSAGAGDGFAAGFLTGQLTGMSLARSCDVGNWVGAMATLVRGDVDGYPDKWAFEAFLGGKKGVER